jgi:hypothetical protein
MSAVVGLRPGVCAWAPPQINSVVAASARRAERLRIGYFGVTVNRASSCFGQIHWGSICDALV